MELPKITKKTVEEVEKQTDYESRFIGKPLKVIFLDIDGVMNSALGTEPYLADMECSKLSLLKKVMTECYIYGIILISDRRYSKPYMNQFLDALDEYEIFMIDEIRKPKSIFEDPEDNRGKQIRDYLSIATDIKKFAILDDNDEGISELYPKEFIQVDRFHGLDEKVCQKIKEVLE